MDPNATLSEIRRIVVKGLTRALTIDESNRLVDLVEALDGWISRGGFLPELWTKKR